MAVPFPLSHVQELGLRGADNDPPDPLLWSGQNLDRDGMLALHRALDPTVMLLCLAGYEPRSAILVRGAGLDDSIELFFDPRRAAAVPDFQQRTGLAPGGADDGRAVIQLVPRAGLGDLPVPLLDIGWGTATNGDGDVWLDIDVPQAGTIAGFAGSMAEGQTEIIDTLVVWIVLEYDRAGSGGVEGTGLLAMLDPDWWDLPEDDPNTESLRKTALEISGQIFTDDSQTLNNFLTADAQLRVVAGTRPPTVRDRLTDDAGLDKAEARLVATGWRQAASNLWDLWLRGGTEPYRDWDHRRFSYVELVADAMNAELFGNLAFDLSTVDAAYGGQSYEVGEDDPHIAELRDDLTTLGFGPLHGQDDDTGYTTATGWAKGSVEYGADWAITYGTFLQAAVREFQIYASMDTVARLGSPEDPEHIESDDPNVVYHHSRGSMLRAVANTDPYTGPKSGVLNDQTRLLLKKWLDEEWVCPVAVEVREISPDDLAKIRKGRPAADPLDLVLKSAVYEVDGQPVDNVWHARQVETLDHIFVAWDVSGTRRTSATTAAGDPAVLCAYTTLGWHGPAAGYKIYSADEFCMFDEAEIRQEDRPDGGDERYAADSTFRIMRAITEVESLGYYDGINAWDNAIISGGLFHNTLGLCKKEDGKGAKKMGSVVLYGGEYAAVLAYYAANFPDDYQRTFGQFGLHALRPWADPPGDHFRPLHAKYANAVGFEGEEGGMVDPRANPPVPGLAAPKINAHDWKLSETFHHWHWVYRFLVAARADPTLRLVFDRLSRARIRALLSIPWPNTDPPLTIGDVVTSELAMGLIERHHVYSPPGLLGVTDKQSELDLIQNIPLGAQLTGAMAAATAVADAAGRASIAEWGDEEEHAIIKSLADDYQGTGVDTNGGFDPVRDWPYYDEEDVHNPVYKLFTPGGLTYLAEPVPSVEVTGPRIAEGRLRVIVRSTATDDFPAAEDPAQLFFVASSNKTEVTVTPADRVPNNTDLVLDPGDWRGTVTLTITGKSRRMATRRTQEVVITSDPDDESAQFALGAQGAEEFIDPLPALGDGKVRGLSARRGSFQLDERNLFNQPDPLGWSD